MRGSFLSLQCIFAKFLINLANRSPNSLISLIPNLKHGSSVIFLIQIALLRKCYWFVWHANQTKSMTTHKQSTIETFKFVWCVRIAHCQSHTVKDCCNFVFGFFSHEVKQFSNFGLLFLLESMIMVQCIISCFIRSFRLFTYKKYLLFYLGNCPRP